MPANPPPASPRHARFAREDPFDKRDPPGLTRILPPQAGNSPSTGSDASRPHAGRGAPGRCAAGVRMSAIGTPRAPLVSGHCPGFVNGEGLYEHANRDCGVCGDWRLSIGAQEPRNVPVEHFSAGSPAMTSAARLTLRPVEIAITQWSTHTEHRALASALIEQGPLAFARLLCNYGAAGSISVTGAPDVVIRYAWSIKEPDGNRRNLPRNRQTRAALEWVAATLPGRGGAHLRQLRVNPDGNGEGKLSDAARLSVDGIRQVIELTGYDGRPAHLLMVHTCGPG